LVSPGIAKASSINANMIPVLCRYHQDLVLMVFCLPGIVMVLILVIFAKPSMLSHYNTWHYDIQHNGTQA
jgi:hypothetical protein